MTGRLPVPAELDAFPFLRPPDGLGWRAWAFAALAAAAFQAAARFRSRRDAAPAEPAPSEPGPPRWEIRDRSWHEGPVNLDGSAPSRPWVTADDDRTLVEVLCVAQGLGRTVDVFDNGAYVVSYCGACPVWWPPGETGAGSHDLSSLGWCRTCLDAGRGYIHHLPLGYEIDVLTEGGLTDWVLRRQLEADGMTAEQRAESVAGRAIPKDGFDCLADLITTGGAFLRGGRLMRQYTVRMKDGRTVERVAVPYDNREYLGYTRDFWAARDLAEQQAHDRPGRVRRCHDCRGLTGHAADCSWTSTRQLLLDYPELRRPGDTDEYRLEVA